MSKTLVIRSSEVVYLLFKGQNGNGFRLRRWGCQGWSGNVSVRTERFLVVVGGGAGRDGVVVRVKKGGGDSVTGTRSE